MLDPKSAELLAWNRASQAQSYRQMGVAHARESYERSAVAIDLPCLPVGEVSDIDVKLPDRTLRARRYRPSKAAMAGTEPIMLFFHGGGFVIGSLATHDRLCRTIAIGARCQVISLDYRLAPEHRFPAAVDDAVQTLAWLRERIADFGADPARLVVGGDSAGGTLAAVCAFEARDRGWPLALQWLLYPGLNPRGDTASHREFSEGYLLDRDTIDWFYDQYIGRDQRETDRRHALVQAQSCARLAAAWVGVAQCDPLRDDGHQYVDRLLAAGVAAHCEEYAGLLHGFAQQRGFIPAAAAAIDHAVTALRDVLHAGQS